MHCKLHRTKRCWTPTRGHRDLSAQLGKRTHELIGTAFGLSPTRPPSRDGKRLRAGAMRQHRRFTPHGRIPAFRFNSTRIRERPPQTVAEPPRAIPHTPLPHSNRPWATTAMEKTIIGSLRNVRLKAPTRSITRVYSINRPSLVFISRDAARLSNLWRAPPPSAPACHCRCSEQ